MSRVHARNFTLRFVRGLSFFSGASLLDHDVRVTVARSLGSCIMFTRRIHSVGLGQLKQLTMRSLGTCLPGPSCLEMSAAVPPCLVTATSRMAMPRPTVALAAPNDRAVMQQHVRCFSNKPSSSSDSTGSKFALPDKEKEQELSRIQVQVQDRYRSGDYRRALTASEELLQETERHFGRDHPATASAYNNVGLIHKQLGDFDASRDNYRSALQIYKKTVGTDHASYASILHNLGNLNRSQIHFDSSLKATDRLTLIEQAAEYLEQAFKIRVEEMGPDHPHTVASKSSWGSTIATQILHHHKASSSANTGKKSYISLLSSEVTQQAWDAAETHLREALQTAVDKPRGPSLQKKKGKKAKKTKSKGAEENSIQTLSAASAAQNLAVFLKTRATTETPHNDDWLAESKRLYEETMSVRTKLLPKGHPDVYATKFSLAELLETMGDEEAANVVRQEIIDTYDPPSEGEPSSPAATSKPKPATSGGEA